MIRRLLRLVTRSRLKRAVDALVDIAGAAVLVCLALAAVTLSLIWVQLAAAAALAVGLGLYLHALLEGGGPRRARSVVDARPVRSDEINDPVEPTRPQL